MRTISSKIDKILNLEYNFGYYITIAIVTNGKDA